MGCGASTADAKDPKAQTAATTTAAAAPANKPADAKPATTAAAPTTSTSSSSALATGAAAPAASTQQKPAETKPATTTAAPAPTATTVAAPTAAPTTAATTTAATAPAPTTAAKTTAPAATTTAAPAATTAAPAATTAAPAATTAAPTATTTAAPAATTPAKTAAPAATTGAAPAAASTGAAAATATAAAAKPGKIDYASVSSKLPYDKTSATQKAERLALFDSFDGNKSGKLSLAELQPALKGHLNLPTIDLDPVIAAAFNTARLAGNQAGKGGDEGFIEKNEFRLVLMYTRMYFEIWELFDSIDTSDDRKVSVEEFKKALPLLKTWGYTTSDPEAAFKSISATAVANVTFDEFAKWALSQKLDSPDDDNNAAV